MICTVISNSTHDASSQKGHYVNRSVRGFRPPARWRISPPRFDLLRLRMLRIKHPDIVAALIPCTPCATHYVVAMPHRPFSPSARLLIPNCGPEQSAHPQDRAPGPLETGRRHGRVLHPRRVRRAHAAVLVAVPVHQPERLTRNLWPESLSPSVRVFWVFSGSGNRC